MLIAIFYLLIGIRVWKRRVAGMRGTRAERNIQRAKIRIVRMLLVVFIIFALSWLPLYSFRLRYYFGPTFGHKFFTNRQCVLVQLGLGTQYPSRKFRSAIINTTDGLVIAPIFGPAAAAEIAIADPKLIRGSIRSSSVVS